jgi:superfamily I DNA/RNA helicase
VRRITRFTSNSESLLSEYAQSQLTDFTFKPYGTEESGEIAFTSAGKFKGMESPVVILIDVDSYSENNDVRNLMYVGLSRARDLLIVLESEKAGCERMTTEKAAASHEMEHAVQ